MKGFEPILPIFTKEHLSYSDNTLSPARNKSGSPSLAVQSIMCEATGGSSPQGRDLCRWFAWPCALATHAVLTMQALKNVFKFPDFLTLGVLPKHNIGPRENIHYGVPNVKFHIFTKKPIKIANLKPNKPYKSSKIRHTRYN